MQLFVNAVAFLVKQQMSHINFFLCNCRCGVKSLAVDVKY